MELLKTEKLCKFYGMGAVSVTALNNVSLSIEEGDFVAVMGSSGSGKSTLLHIVGGVDRPTKGSVFIDGEDISLMNDDELSAFRCKNIGMVYQFFNLLPVFNVEENILLPSLLAGKDADFKRVKKLLKMLGMEKRNFDLPSNLSGGQQQRIAVARALINEPRLILADEPTGNLDSRNSEDIMLLLKKANEENGQTIILVTHDEKIAAYAKKTIVLEDGKIVEQRG